MSEKKYQEYEFLHLSGIQHFHFCRRQWALITIEQQWQENIFTAEGRIIHDRVDDPFFSEVRVGVIITRSMPVSSHTLGLSGICDVVEFIDSPEGVSLFGHTGTYMPIPIEYKRGKKKIDTRDDVQLCAQAMCLEEMLCVDISYGFIYYKQTRSRTKVDFEPELRNLVIKLSEEMHTYFKRGYTPKVKPTKACKSCSLEGVCLPKLAGSANSVSKYIDAHIESD